MGCKRVPQYQRFTKLLEKIIITTDNAQYCLSSVKEHKIALFVL